MGVEMGKNKRKEKLKSYLLFTTLTNTQKISNACGVHGNAILKTNSKARNTYLYL